MSLRRATTRAGSGDGSRRPSPDALSDEREFLQRSIEDLEAERASGLLDEEDFAILDSRYERRLAEVEEAIAKLVAPGAKAPGRETPGAKAPGRETPGAKAPGAKVPALAAPPESRANAEQVAPTRPGEVRAASAASSCFACPPPSPAARKPAGEADHRDRRERPVSWWPRHCWQRHWQGVRLPGESATGTVSLSSAQQERETLDRAAILGSEGQVANAVQLYNEVLQKDPEQPDALTYGGWLVRLAGLSSRNRLVVARGDASVARAVKVAPGYPDGHALYGVILYEDFARPVAAVAQFRDALSAGASKSLLMSVAEVAARAFEAAREPLPRSYGAVTKGAAGPAGG